jgi:hypothetical protein
MALVIGLPVIGAICAVGIGAIAGFTTYRQLESTTAEMDRLRADEVHAAAVMYVAEHGSGCPSADDLVEAGTLYAGSARDSRGNAWRLECEGVTIHVRGGGSDGSFGTRDDIDVTR